MPEPFNPYHAWLGIPAGKGRPHHYQLLGLQPFEDAAHVIESAADRQMAHLRTFQSGARAAESQRLLNEVAAARICLLKPEQKAAYDARLRAALAQSSSGALPTARPLVPAPVAAMPEPAPGDVIDSFVVHSTALSTARGASRGGASKRTNRGKKSGVAGPGTYCIVVLAIGIVGLAGILWVRANHFQIQLVDADQTGPAPASKPAKPDATAGGKRSDIKKPEAGVPKNAAPKDEADTDDTPVKKGPTAVKHEATSDSVPARIDRPEVVESAPEEKAKARIADPFSSPGTPRVSSTTKTIADGRVCWFLGGVNATANRSVQKITERTYSFPPRSFCVHPAPANAVAINWRSPASGRFRIKGRIVDCDAAGGDGVVWQLSHWESPTKFNVLAGGVIDNGKSSEIVAPGEPAVGGRRPLAILAAGEGLQISISPRGDYGCDNTLAQWEISEVGGSSRVWNVTEHMLSCPPTVGLGDLRADRFGNADIWSVSETAAVDERALSQQLAVETSRAAAEAERAEKSPIPSEAQQSETQKLVDELFKADLAAAKKSGTLAELAKKILQQAVDSQGDAAAQYVLYGMARDIAAEGGNPLVAMQSIDGLARTFRIDALNMKTVALVKISQSKVGPPSRSALIEAALPLIDQAAEADRFELVQLLGKAALEAALANRDLARANQLRALGKELVALQKQYDEAHAAILVLKQSPEDVAANLTAGRWYCLTKGDWPTGLPYLLKSADADLAKQEIAAPAGAADLQKLADSWWDAAENASSELIKARMRSRAAMHYRAAMPGLSGLSKVKAEKRVDEMSSGASAPAGDSIDLLKLIDPARDSANGKWRISRGALVSPNMEAAKLVIPFVPPRSYHLTVEGARTGGSVEALVVGVIVDGRQAMVVIDGLGGGVSGLEMIDGKILKDNSTRTDIRNILGDKTPFSISITVHSNSINVIANQRAIIGWKGNASSLSVNDFWSVPRRDCLFLAADHTEIKLTKVSIKPLYDSAK